mmetsp:Transcript_42458/g.137759  ORF Transcript_42458/g.137759 Transcript_42458/m.137759 type:complete len:341 (-) Transcript_42458:1135-2157(-)
MTAACSTQPAPPEAAAHEAGAASCAAIRSEVASSHGGKRAYSSRPSARSSPSGQAEEVVCSAWQFPPRCPYVKYAQPSADARHFAAQSCAELAVPRSVWAARHRLLDCTSLYVHEPRASTLCSLASRTVLLSKRVRWGGKSWWAGVARPSFGSPVTASSLGGSRLCGGRSDSHSPPSGVTTSSRSVDGEGTTYSKFLTPASLTSIAIGVAGSRRRTGSRNGGGGEAGGKPPEPPEPSPLAALRVTVAASENAHGVPSACTPMSSLVAVPRSEASSVREYAPCSPTLAASCSASARPGSFSPKRSQGYLNETKRSGSPSVAERTRLTSSTGRPESSPRLSA